MNLKLVQALKQVKQQVAEPAVDLSLTIEQAGLLLAILFKEQARWEPDSEVYAIHRQLRGSMIRTLSQQRRP